MLILGIETSCDETSCAVVESKNDKIIVHSNVIRSQIKLHAPYGGVVPSLAAREHVVNLPIVLKEALKKAKSKMKDIDAIAVTSGPGLIPALLVGVSFAQALAYQYRKPLIGTNHMEGHVYSNWLTPIRISKAQVLISKSQITISKSIPKLNDKTIFPSVCLVVSGGHTQLILMKSHHPSPRQQRGYGLASNKYKLLGQTLDDAAGEAFDKIARIIELPYPGGPSISAEASKYQIIISKSQINNKLQIPIIKFPRPMLDRKGYNFSFSGLKTAVLYKVQDLKTRGSTQTSRGSTPKLSHTLRCLIAHEAQEAIVDVLVEKTKRAAQDFGAKSIMLSGGVSANRVLRERLQTMGAELNIPVFIPEMNYTTDNAGMIAMATIFKLIINNQKIKNKIPKFSLDMIKKVKANANWEIV